MISILSVVGGFFVLWMMWQRQRPAFIAGIFIIYSLAYRLIDIGYLDISGPIYAIELERHVGGNGAAPMFLLSTLCFLLPLWRLASQKRLMAGVHSPLPANGYFTGLQRLALLIGGAIIAFLYLDMLRIGTIPLFAGMDRQDYSDVAGILHNRAYEMNFLLCASLGAFTVLPRLQGGRYALSFAGLLIATIVYWALTGNRFSAFLTCLAFYAIPFAAVLAMERGGALPPRKAADAWSALLSTRILLPLGMIFGTFAVGGLLYNSYYSVRDYADPAFQISQRVLVQPVQIWASSWEAAAMNPDRGIDYRTLDYVVLNPLISDSNTTIRFLMEKELGYFRANELIALGQQYAGGYPEIFFEIFGMWLAPLFMLLFGIAASYLVYTAVRSLVKGCILTSIMAVYVFFGFCVGYIGGMLNFLLAVTFAAKIVVLVIVMTMERAILLRNAAQIRSVHANGLPVGVAS